MEQHNDWTNKDYVKYFIFICRLRDGSHYFNKNVILCSYERPENISELLAAIFRLMYAMNLIRRYVNGNVTPLNI